MSIRIIEKSEERESGLVDTEPASADLVSADLVDAELPMHFGSDAWEYDPSLEAPLTDEEIFSRSLIGMSIFLGLQQQELAVVLGLSQAQVTRISSRRYVLSPQKAKEWEIACVFARLHDGLVARFEGDRVATLRWLNFYCAELGERPVVLMQTFEGLLRCVDFIENN